MLAIFRKEIMTFFASAVGYLVIGFFLILSGLFLWVFKGPFNIPEYGFADMGNFFLLAPWVFLFLVPAITMKSFSEELKLGTMENLYIKPVSLWQIVIGKFLGAATLAVMAVLPTGIYVYSISQLGVTRGNLDLGLVWGSYFGLLFLISGFTAIGQFTSSLTESQIVAFIAGLVLCFGMYYAFDALSTLFAGGETAVFIRKLGMKWHFERIAGGVIDSRDLLYFISLTAFFVYISVLQLKFRNR